MTIPVEFNPIQVYSIKEQMPDTIPDALKSSLADSIPAILERHVPGKQVIRIIDRGQWDRRIFEVELDSGEAVVVKFILHEEWPMGPQKTKALYDLLVPRGLCAVEQIALDCTKTIAPLWYIIEKKGSGVRLDRLLKSCPAEDHSAIYRAIGRHYRVMHSIPGSVAGYWVDTPDKPFPIHPAEFYLQNDIGGPDGSGHQLVKMGLLQPQTLERVVETWRRNLDELKNHPVVLVHGTAAPWTIYLEKDAEGNYRVSRMGAMDHLWWDAAFDLAMLRWPPLFDTLPEDWQTLAQAYGPLPDQKRFLLYRQMQSLITACWAYEGPRTAETEAWLAGFRRTLDQNLNSWTDQIEG